MAMHVCVAAKKDSHGKQNNYQQRGSHQNNNWYFKRNLIGYIARMTSVTSSTAFTATKYCKNFEKEVQ